MLEQAPLILTLHLDDVSFTFFNNLRQQHFPAARNFLQAHLTLFHHLPPGEAAIKSTLQAVAAQQKVLELQVVAVVSIGKGVAYKIQSTPLVQLHKQLQQQWWAWLPPQDRQTLWPHVTVQNKVAPAEAKNLQQQLAASLVPFAAYGTGFRLWAYLQGPWQLLEEYAFR